MEHSPLSKIDEPIKHEAKGEAEFKIKLIKP